MSEEQAQAVGGGLEEDSDGAMGWGLFEGIKFYWKVDEEGLPIVGQVDNSKHWAWVNEVDPTDCYSRDSWRLAAGVFATNWQAQREEITALIAALREARAEVERLRSSARNVITGSTKTTGHRSIVDQDDLWRLASVLQGAQEQPATPEQEAGQGVEDIGWTDAYVRDIETALLTVQERNWYDLKYDIRKGVKAIRTLKEQLAQAQARVRELEGMVAHLEASSAWQIGSAVIRGKYKEWEAAHIEQEYPHRDAEGVDN